MLRLLAGWRRIARRGWQASWSALRERREALRDAFRRPNLHMVVVNPHIGASVELDAHDGFVRKLKPPDAINQHGLAVRRAGQADHRAGGARGASGGAGGQWRVAAD